MTEINHTHHNLEPNYWDIMLKDISDPNSGFYTKGTAALEYGCGAGRNLVNMALLGQFSRVDGIDISKDNASNSSLFVEQRLSSIGISTCCVEGDGYSCLPLPPNFYTFVMSDQVFIHIPNYEIRALIIRDIIRILVKGGVFVVHFITIADSVEYYFNFNGFPKNVSPSSSEQLLTDFSSYGFASVTVYESTNFYNGLPEWYVRCVK
jgi:SAM-dependent methyltransferase